MPVQISVTTLDTYHRNLFTKTCTPGVRPRLLNEDPVLYRAKTFRTNKMNLSLGCEGFQDQGHGDRLQTLLDYLLKTFPPGSCLKEKIDADFITGRRSLRLIAASCHGKQESFVMQALRHNGVIFLCEKKSRGADKRPYPYGYKFEMNMTLDENGKPHDMNAPVSNSESHKAVIRTTLSSGSEQLKMYYSAEVDAIDSKGNLVEIKTTSMKPSMWPERAGLRASIQSLLANVPYVIIGFNHFFNKAPHVYSIEKRVTSCIKHKNVTWNKNRCIELLYETLKTIKDELQNDDEALLITIKPDGVIKFEEEDKDECTFLSEKFLAHFT